MDLRLGLRLANIHPLVKENKLRSMKIVETKKSVKEKREIFNSLETMFNKGEGGKTTDDQVTAN